MDYRITCEKILEEYRQVFERVDEKGMREFIDTVKAHERIFLIGVGREGMATRAFAMRLMHMGKEIHWIWDDTTPSIGKGDLLIATLGDGRIGHINYICERAKAAGATLYVVTGSPSGDWRKIWRITYFSCRRRSIGGRTRSSLLFSRWEICLSNVC